MLKDETCCDVGNTKIDTKMVKLKYYDWTRHSDLFNHM